MDTPISWIKAYVPDLDCTPQEYADKMTCRQACSLSG